MKHLLFSLATLSLISTSVLLSEEHTSVQKYSVHIIKENAHKKGFGSKIFIKIKDYMLEVGNKVSIEIFAKEVESYVNTNGLNVENLTQHFNGKLNISLIKDFQTSKENYRVNEPIQLNYALRQKSYSYLMSVASDGACLVYPNQNDSDNMQGFGYHALPTNRSYNILSNAKGNVEFYLMTSLKRLDFSDFKANSIYRCTSRNKGLNKVAEIQNDHINDVKRYDAYIN